MAVVAEWRLKSNSTASVYNNGTDTSMTYSGSNAILSGSGYVEVNDGSWVIHGTSACTVECMLKVTGSWDQFIFSGWEYGGFFIKNSSGNLLTSALYTTGAFNENSTGVTGNDGKWHHVAIVYTGSNKISYVDGVQKHTIAQTWTIRDNGGGSPRYIQVWTNRQAWPTYTSKMTGGVTEARIDSTWLSASAVKNRYAWLTWFF